MEASVCYHLVQSQFQAAVVWIAPWRYVPMSPEIPNSPDQAHQERQIDLDHIGEKLDQFRATAMSAFVASGRGAIFVDTTFEPSPGAGHPFAYLAQEQVDEIGHEDTKRMVTDYDPVQELVVVLLKPGDRISTYRIGLDPDGPQKIISPEAHSGRAAEQVAETELEPPDIETLIEWEAEGGCEAACPHGCWVEPDGTCPHGDPVLDVNLSAEVIGRNDRRAAVPVGKVVRLVCPAEGIQTPYQIVLLEHRNLITSCMQRRPVLARCGAEKVSRSGRQRLYQPDGWNTCEANVCHRFVLGFIPLYRAAYGVLVVGRTLSRQVSSVAGVDGSQRSGIEVAFCAPKKLETLT
jgi:hypothetical protein